MAQELRLLFFSGGLRPTVLKKSTSASIADNYASEIEICVLRRRLRALIGRNSAQKLRFQRPMHDLSGQIDCFQQHRPKAAFGIVWKADGNQSRPPI